MPSPFPGMNPYFERPGIWPEFHGALVYQFRKALAAQVVPRYFVRVGERVHLREMPDGPTGLQVGQPDVSLTTPEADRPGPPAPTRVAMSVPAVEEERVRFLEVVTPAGEVVVTTVELLSPSNKYAGIDREQYLRKRRRLIRHGVNLVEIDPLRGGPRTLPGLPSGDTFVILARPTELSFADVWPIPLRQPLPPIPIPLRPGEAEPTLDLQAALHAVYDDGGYSHFLYRGDPDPPLAPADAAWARTLLPPA